MIVAAGYSRAINIHPEGCGYEPQQSRASDGRVAVLYGGLESPRTAWRRMRQLRSKGIKDLYSRVLEIRDIPRDHGQVVAMRGGGELTIE